MPPWLKDKKEDKKVKELPGNPASKTKGKSKKKDKKK